VFKGLKNILADHPVNIFIEHHLLLSLFICWVVCSLLLFLIQRFKINILRITILSGTFALALAFAGNDLVNFIGVPVADIEKPINALRTVHSFDPCTACAVHVTDRATGKSFETVTSPWGVK